MFNKMGVQVTIRDVDPDVFREFKADAVKKRMKLGTAISLAMEKFRVEMKDKKLKFTDWKPTNWGKGTEHISEEVDKILYS